MRKCSKKTPPKKKNTYSIGVVFSEETGELLRVVKAENDYRMFLGAALQEKERLAKVFRSDFREADSETFGPIHVETKVKPLVQKGLLCERAIGFDEYL